MQLTHHFTREDLERSDFAERNDIPNRIPDDTLHIWTEGLIQLVEPACHFFPDARYPESRIHITSAYRSEDLNRRIGGSGNSQHLGRYWDKTRQPKMFSNCCAFDLVLLNHPGGNRKLWNFFAMQPPLFDQIIWEFGTDQHPAWVHISLVPGGNNRRQVLRAVRTTDSLGNKKTVYSPLDTMPGNTDRCHPEHPQGVKDLSGSSLSNRVAPQPALTKTLSHSGGSSHA